jgi:hypothetical protein
MVEIAGLTDRTIHQVYFHARTKEGAIDFPADPVAAAGAVEEGDEPPTEEGEIRALDFLRMAGLITDDANYRQCVEDIKRKFRGPGP